MSEDNIVEQIAKWKEQSQKYDSLKERLNEIEREISGSIEHLENIRSKINPFSNVKERKKRSVDGNMKYSEQVAELFNILEAGTHIDRGFVERTYKDLDSNQISNIMVKVKKLKGVQKRKDGVKVFYYL